MLKKIIHNCAVIIIVVMALCIATSMAHAATIDTTGTDEDTIYDFGAPNTATYGQTFAVSGTDTLLNSFSLYLRNRIEGAGSLDLRGYIAGWDGHKASTILYESTTQTMNAGGNLQEFNFSTGGLNLVAGDFYVAFLSISNLGVQPDSRFGMPHSSDAIPGQFVFINNGTNFSLLTGQDWFLNFIGNKDTWFKADLSPGSSVPEPTTMLFLGFGLIGVAGIKRKFKN